MNTDPQDYELTALQIGDWKDSFGNTMVTVAFKGVSEPVSWLMKDPADKAIGQTYYGRLEDKTSKAGRPYLRFFSVLKEDAKDAIKYQGGKQYAKAKAETSDGMKQGMCFNNAAAYVLSQSKKLMAPEQWAKLVREYAEALYKLVDLNEVVEEIKPDEMDDISRIFGLPEPDESQ